jgi:hypothetical protein
VAELPRTPQEISFPVQDLPRFQGRGNSARLNVRNVL